MTIETATYSDRGFARLGNVNDRSQFFRDRCLTDTLLKNIYEFETTSQGIWIRSKERRSANVVYPLQKLAVISSNNYQDADKIDEIDPDWPSNNWSYPQALNNVKLAKNKRIIHQIELYSRALFFLSPKYRAKFLKENYFPWFFSKYPKGKIVMLKVNFGYVGRLSLFRHGFATAIYSLNELRNAVQKSGSLKFITGLQNTSTVNIEQYLQAITNLFFPFYSPVVCDGMGYILILFTGKRKVIDRGFFPRSWRELLISQQLMRGDQPDFLSNNPENGWKGRYIPQGNLSTSQFLTLLDDAVLKINRLINLRLDITNYRDANNEIDFAQAFKSYFTFDRAIIELNDCQCATNGLTARLLTFSILDKFSELMIINERTKTDLFKDFFKKEFNDNILKPAIKSYPKFFEKIMLKEMSLVYNSLYEFIFSDENLMTDRSRQSNILIKKWHEKSGMFKDTTISKDDFIGNLVRFVRNTHHGYILKQKIFETYGSIHTGKLPDCITAIPQLIWLAILSKPEELLLPNWISDATLRAIEI